MPRLRRRLHNHAMKSSQRNHFTQSRSLRKAPVLLLAALFCGFAAAQAPASHPLTGTWTWTLPGKSCLETWQYSANGTRQVSSDDEVTQADYAVPSRPSLLGFYRLVETVTQSNGKPDCAGDLHEASGDSVTHFIQLSPKLDQMIVCKEESLKACFGPLKRAPEQAARN